MDTTILAIDLGKFNSVLCWYDSSTRSTAFRSIRTGHAELHKELTRQPVRLVVFEACSQAGWVHDLCTELGLEPLGRTDHELEPMRSRREHPTAGVSIPPRLARPDHHPLGSRLAGIEPAL